jgi:hypothetical protein
MIVGSVTDDREAIVAISVKGALVPEGGEAAAKRPITGARNPALTSARNHGTAFDRLLPSLLWHE